VDLYPTPWRLDVNATCEVYMVLVTRRLVVPWSGLEGRGRGGWVVVGGLGDKRLFDVALHARQKIIGF
jgi:hypothetical protein